MLKEHNCLSNRVLCSLSIKKSTVACPRLMAIDLVLTLPSDLWESMRLTTFSLNLFWLLWHTSQQIGLNIVIYFFQLPLMVFCICHYSCTGPSSWDWLTFYPSFLAPFLVSKVPKLCSKILTKLVTTVMSSMSWGVIQWKAWNKGSQAAKKRSFTHKRCCHVPERRESAWCIACSSKSLDMLPSTTKTAQWMVISSSATEAHSSMCNAERWPSNFWHLDLQNAPTLNKFFSPMDPRLSVIQ